jgi:sugar/nucleoside kinase (ribokinase family)
MAADGSAIYDGNSYYRIPAYEVDAIDPTGAGDTYGAGFLIKYLETSDLERAGYYGSCVSSVMVENVGPDFPLTRAEADRRFGELWNNRKGR